MIPLRFTVGVSAVLALMFVLAIKQLRTPEARTARFEDADTVFVVSNKGDMESIVPRRVVTERFPEIVAPIVVKNSLATINIIDKPKPRRVAFVEVNICTQHKMRKVYTNNGRSWRCQR
jgi:hypothetical protein